MIIAIHMTDVIRDLYIERIGGCDATTIGIVTVRICMTQRINGNKQIVVAVKRKSIGLS